MKKGLLFTCMIALLFWAMPSWAWYPDQEKDGVKDTASPEEAKKLMEKGTYGMRKDYEPKPGFPWHEDLEKGTLSGEQIMYLEDDNKEEAGFHTHTRWRSSLYLNSRGQYAGTGGPSTRYYTYNDGLKPGPEDNYKDVFDYHEGKIKAGDLYRLDRSGRYFPPLSFGENTLQWFYLKTPEVYKEPDRWKYFPGRRKVIRLGAASKSILRGGGIATYDDTGGRAIWEHEYTILGTDVLKPEDTYYGTYDFFDESGTTKVKRWYTKPIECWVILSKPRDPGYYLGQQIYWIEKSKDHKKIRNRRWEQYDRGMNLWKLREPLWSAEPFDKEAGDYVELNDTAWDLRRDFRDAVIFMDGPFPVSNLVPWGNLEDKNAMRQFFSIDAIRSEKFWVGIPDQTLRKKRWDVFSKTNPNKLLRDRFPEHRKIVLRKEIEEKVRKLVEKGIFE